MLNINIACVGNLKEKYLRDASSEYSKRLSRFCKLNIYEADEKNPEKEKLELLKKSEGFSVALCIEGGQFSSEEFAEFIKKSSNTTSKITFIIGGSEGLSNDVKEKSNLKLSFSKMTLPHQLMRIVLLEQIYRAFSINSNTAYHK